MFSNLSLLWLLYLSSCCSEDTSCCPSSRSLPSLDLLTPELNLPSDWEATQRRPRSPHLTTATCCSCGDRLWMERPLCEIEQASSTGWKVWSGNPWGCPLDKRRDLPNLGGRVEARTEGRRNSTLWTLLNLDNSWSLPFLHPPPPPLHFHFFLLPPPLRLLPDLCTDVQHRSMVL